MNDWIEQYTAALAERDAREQAHAPYFEAYTKLADRTATLTAQTSLQPRSRRPESSHSIPTSPRLSNKATSRNTSAEIDTSTLANDVSRLRVDLASTQKARSALQANLETVQLSLTQLQVQHSSTVASHGALTKQKGDLERKLRDRDEELQLKRKLVEHAQDEMVALQLELHFAEDRANKFESENKELVERWMKKKSEEAEKVNRDSKWS
ncbi:Hypothetical protein R9X50_00268200 [Acrodontium crateriforme]|uniref:Autophagy-related protein 16 domain-containing protein n=1 Tax=Acrodontium crateriforme TaxID=150365 RepID=A0AAQ3RB68_9PEZI|nr:Hypothetical protein R9X50_00268200 [Acrodontium crateriforme]